jgi:hypothetical protein
MARRTLILVAALGLTSSPAAVGAQTTPVAGGQARTEAAPARARTPVDEKADPLAEQRRELASSLLIALADEARSYTEPTLSARVQARVANVLWERDQERARSLFRRSWDAAVAADKESARRAAESRRRGQMSFVPNLREEVLKLAARRDRALGDEFLEKFDQEKAQEATATVRADDPASRLSPTSRSAEAQRLTIARQLLKSGDTERAIQFADAALDRVSFQGIIFLSALRQSNAEAADRRFAALLARAAADPLSDANTVSLLSSYAFSPFFILSYTPRGPVAGQYEPPVPAPDLAPQLRASFFAAAAQVLLRPLPPKGQDTTTAGRVGLYFITARLLPLFERFAPDKAAALRTQLATLSPDTPDNVRSGNDAALSQGLVPEAAAEEDDLQSALDQLGRSSDPAERDRLNTRAAIAAAQKGDPRAEEFADAIKDAESQKRVRAFVDFAAVKRAIDRKDAAEVRRLARRSHITDVQRAWALTAAAGILKKSDPAQAVQLIEEAVAEARRIDETRPDRVRSLVAVATQVLSMDQSRAWEITSEAVKAANAGAGFTGEDGRVTARFQAADEVFVLNSSVPDFDLTGIFGELARVDANRAVDLARGLKADAPRAVAVLAIARAMLADKSKATS